MTAPALLLDASEARTDAAPRQGLSLVAGDAPGRQIETPSRARLAALLTAQLWSSILGRRAAVLDRTIAGAVHAAVRELGRDLGG